jgi:hypothetical protein
MKHGCLVCLMCVLAGCSHEVRCDGHLRPINALSPAREAVGQSHQSAREARSNGNASAVVRKP